MTKLAGIKAPEKARGDTLVQPTSPPTRRRRAAPAEPPAPALPPPRNIGEDAGDGVELGGHGFTPPDVPAVFGADSFKNLEPPYKVIFVPAISEDATRDYEGRVKIILDLVQRANIPADDRDWVAMKCELALQAGRPGVWDETVTYLLSTMGHEGLRVKQFMEVSKGVQVTPEKTQEDGQLPPMMIR